MSANGTIGWDDEVSAQDAGENTQEDFVILPNGTYPCEVKKIERSTFKGSAKLPPCNMVKIEALIDGGDLGRSYSYYRFYMHTSCLWKIYQFLEAVGLRRQGDNTAARIPWDKVSKGMTCRCAVKTREYDGKTYNEITKWFPADAADGAEENELDDSDF